MTRRLMLIAGLWLGFLGIVQPVLACVVNPAMVDCCSGDLQMPCDSGAGQMGTDEQSITCCVTAPSTAPAVMAPVSKDTHLAQATGGHPPDGIIAALDWPLPVVDNLSSVSKVPILHVACRGTQTYLRTGRLRL